MKSRFKCVFWHTKNCNWVAKVKVNYKARHLGVFATEEAANATVLAFKRSNGLIPEDGERPSLETAFAYREGKLYARYPSSCIKTGDAVGSVCKTHGYVIVGFGGESHRAHDVVWRMFNGAVPRRLEIDHINGDRQDNRIENLRVVTKAENARNRKRPKNNSSGEIGVQRRSSGNFQVRVAGRHIGTFCTLAAAAKARREHGAAAGFHDNHGRTA